MQRVRALVSLLHHPLRSSRWLPRFTGLLVLSLTWFVAGILLEMIYNNRLFAPVVYEWLQRKKQAEDELDRVLYQ